MHGAKDIDLSDDPNVVALLNAVASTTYVVGLFEKSIAPTDQEMIEVTRFYQRILAEYNIIHHDRDFLGYYVVDTHHRHIHGMRPAAYTELVFIMCYIAIIIFGNRANVGRVSQWFREMGAYYTKIDTEAWLRTSQEVVDGLRRQMAAR